MSVPSILSMILERRRQILERNRRPVEIELGELQARRLLDEIKDSGMFQSDAVDRLTWRDIFQPSFRLYGMPAIGVVWPEHLEVRADCQSEMPTESRLKP